MENRGKKKSSLSQVKIFASEGGIRISMRAKKMWKVRRQGTSGGCERKKEKKLGLRGRNEFKIKTIFD